MRANAVSPTSTSSWRAWRRTARDPEWRIVATGDTEDAAHAALIDVVLRSRVSGDSIILPVPLTPSDPPPGAEAMRYRRGRSFPRPAH